MKKNLLFILILIFSISTGSAQVDFVWGKQFGTDSDERTRNLIIDSLKMFMFLVKPKVKLEKRTLANMMAL